MEAQTKSNLPIACDLTALGADVGAAHLELARRLVSEGAAEAQELPNGYAFRFLASQYDQVSQFIANERLCCPFFRFTLDVAPAQGPIWLHITGDAEVKEFLRSGFAGSS